jgi:hypothetical protein
VVGRPGLAAVAALGAQGFLVFLAKFMVEVRNMLWQLEHKLKGKRWMEIVLKPALIPRIYSWRKGSGRD